MVCLLQCNLIAALFTLPAHAASARLICDFVSNGDGPRLFCVSGVSGVSGFGSLLGVLELEKQLSIGIRITIEPRTHFLSGLEERYKSLPDRN
jgi:hypothetical protein